ncbi:hypothetical protein [Deinococcus enclensis]|uniref:Right handed beta helix region n=1 Tax=Deinococcus enclensis TaxID=1049582 RepID=A0ABT9ME40_9DEIO|nr:hypothetical protein [Deinococcus enclensis]MDP9764862.1 hypothetical protein [Deinococcus enclensis]
MPDQVFTTGNANVQAFTNATAYAQSRAQAAEQERAATEAARLALPTQVQALTAPAVNEANAAAAAARVAAGLAGSVGTEAELVGKPAGQYRVGVNLVTWNGNSVTASTPALATAEQATAAQDAADTAQAQADSASDRVQASVAGLDALTLTAGRVQTELGAFDVIPEAGQAVNGGTVRSIGVPGYVAKLGTSGPLDFRLFRPDLSGNGATQNTAKLQAAITEAVTNHESADLLLPPGLLRVSGAMIAEAAPDIYRSLTIRGAGTGVTRIVQNADADLISTDLKGQGTLTVRDVSLLADVMMVDGAAVRMPEGGYRIPALIMRDVEILSNVGQWRYGVRTKNAIEPYFSKVMIRGQPLSWQANSGKWMDGIYIEADAPSMAVKMHACGIYQVRRGIWADNRGNPGIEGLQVSLCDIVDVMEGIRFENSAPYSPPQVLVTGGHMNFRQYGVFVNKGVQIQIDNLLAYARGVEAGEPEALDVAGRIGIYVPEGRNVQISNVQMYSIFGGAHDYDAVVLGNVQKGQITNVHAAFKGAAGAVLYLGDQSADIQYGTIQRESGVACVSDLGAGNRSLGGIMPPDPLDVKLPLNVTAALDLTRLRAEIVKLLGSGTVSSITPLPGRRVTFVADNPVTFTHAAGLLLAGDTDATITGGRSITLYHDGDTWREAGRS